jgi:hypothetical protein
VTDNKPIVQVNRVRQVCVVVNDIQRAMEQYWNTLGIGPWLRYDFEPPRLTNTTLHGNRQPYSMKLALAEIGPPDHEVMWELVEPMEGPSIYKEFLERHGEGLQHAWFMTDESFDDSAKAMADHGISIIQSGNYAGSRYAYLDTEEHLSMVAEIVDWPDGWDLPAPDGIWPPQG